jgi:hypothetical protein
MCAQRPKNSQPQYDQQRDHPKQSLCKPAQDRAIKIFSLMRGKQRNSAVCVIECVMMRVIMRMI